MDEKFLDEPLISPVITDEIVPPPVVTEEILYPESELQLYDQFIQDGIDLDYLYLLDRKDYHREMLSGTFDSTKKTRIDNWLDKRVDELMEGVRDGYGEYATPKGSKVMEGEGI